MEETKDASSSKPVTGLSIFIDEKQDAPEGLTILDLIKNVCETLESLDETLDPDILSKIVWLVESFPDPSKEDYFEGREVAKKIRDALSPEAFEELIAIRDSYLEIGRKIAALIVEIDTLFGKRDMEVRAEILLPFFLEEIPSEKLSTLVNKATVLEKVFSFSEDWPIKSACAFPLMVLHTAEKTGSKPKTQMSFYDCEGRAKNIEATLSQRAPGKRTRQESQQSFEAECIKKAGPCVERIRKGALCKKLNASDISKPHPSEAVLAEDTKKLFHEMGSKSGLRTDDFQINYLRLAKSILAQDKLLIPGRHTELCDAFFEDDGSVLADFLFETLKEKLEADDRDIQNEGFNLATFVEVEMSKEDTKGFTLCEQVMMKRLDFNTYPDTFSLLEKEVLSTIKKTLIDDLTGRLNETLSENHIFWKNKLPISLAYFLTASLLAGLTEMLVWPLPNLFGLHLFGLLHIVAPIAVFCLLAFLVVVIGASYSISPRAKQYILRISMFLLMGSTALFFLIQFSVLKQIPIPKWHFFHIFASAQIALLVTIVFVTLFIVWCLNKGANKLGAIHRMQPFLDRPPDTQPIQQFVPIKRPKREKSRQSSSRSNSQTPSREGSPTNKQPLSWLGSKLLPAFSSPRIRSFSSFDKTPPATPTNKETGNLRTLRTPSTGSSTPADSPKKPDPPSETPVSSSERPDNSSQTPLASPKERRGLPVSLGEATGNPPLTMSSAFLTRGGGFFRGGPRQNKDQTQDEDKKQKKAREIKVVVTPAVETEESDPLLSADTSTLTPE